MGKLQDNVRRAVNRRMYALLIALSVVCAGAPANAISLDVFGTGQVAGGGAPLVGAGSADTNWVIFSKPAPPMSGTISQLTTPNPGWTAPTTLPNQWISVKPSSISPAGNLAVGDYIFRFDFAMPASADPSTAVISGFFASDNSSELRINDVAQAGAAVASIPPFNPPGQPVRPFTQLTSFTINSGFTAGVNSLTVKVNNRPSSSGGNTPMGLYLEVTSAEAVPAPSTILGLASLGLVGFVGYFRRRRPVRVS